MKGNVYKLQLAFSDGLPRELTEQLTVLHQSALGSLHLLIVRGKREELSKIIAPYRPLICDFLPLSLEEIFIYELGGIDHEIKNCIL